MKISFRFSWRQHRKQNLFAVFLFFFTLLSLAQGEREDYPVQEWKLEHEQVWKGWAITSSVSPSFYNIPTLVTQSESPDGKTSAICQEYLCQNLTGPGPTISFFRYRLLLKRSGKIIYQVDYRKKPEQPSRGFWTKSGRFFIYELTSENSENRSYPFRVVDCETSRYYTDIELGKGFSISPPILAGDEKISYVARLKGHTSETGNNPVSTIDLLDWIKRHSGKQ